MPLLHTLVAIDVLHRPTGERRIIRAASANLREITGLNGQVWEPCMTSPPQITMRLFNGDFKAEVEPGNALLPLNMVSLKKTYTWADQCHWKDAKVSIWAGAAGQAWPWTQIFAGKVQSWDRRAQVLTLTADVAFDDKDILTATYAGSGGAEGGADIKGRVKPLCIGWPLNVEPVLINAVDNVYQFSAYGAIEAVTALYERGSNFGASVGDYASYAALVGASIPNGRWATCLAEGMIRLGAPAAGVITGDIKGIKSGATTPRLTGAIISKLAEVAGVSTSVIETASLTALDTAVPYPISLVMNQQESFVEMAQKLALPCNAQSGISMLGKFFVLPISLSASPSVTLNAQGRALPQVLNALERDTSNPYARTVFGAQRSWRVHSDDEIATLYKLEYLGRYSGSTFYREGNQVDQPDGSTWLYINATPSAGNAPPTPPATSNAYWQRLNGAYTASDLTYADGTAIESLKPQEIGSNKTETRTAAAISGQGDLATQNRSTLAFGANLAVNSEFALVDPTYGGGTNPVGWQPGWLGDSTNTGAFTTNPRRISLQDGSYAYARDVTGTPNGSVMDVVQSYPSGLPLSRFAVPVLPGERIAYSALLGYQGCSRAYAVIGFYDENGNYVDEYGAPNVTASIGAAAYNTITRTSLGQSSTALTVPADGSGGGTGKRRWAVIWARFDLNGSANPRLILAAPMISKVMPNQTAIPAYTPGPADRQASYGATTGTNLVSPTYGNLTDAGVYTPIGTAAAIAGQAWAATNGAQAVVSNAYAAFGAGQNRVRFSMFEKGNTGWAVRYNPSGIGASQTAFFNNGLRIGKLDMTYTGAAQVISLGTIGNERYRIPVMPGEYLYISMGTRGLGAVSSLQRVIGFMASDGVTGLASYTLPTNTGALLGGILEKWEGFVQVPASCYFAYLEVYAYSSGAGAASLEITQSMVVGAIAGQVSFPTFSPGPGAEYGSDITGENVASAITGQGPGATAANLAAFDATAAAQLTTAYNGGVMTVGLGETLKRKIANSASIDLDGQVSVNAGGSTSGNIKARIEVSLYGANSWSTVNTGPGASVTPSEPGTDNVAGTFTNSSGLEQLYEFRVVIVRTPGTAGGTLINSQSFIVG